MGGTGIMCIKRGVLDKMMEVYKDDYYNTIDGKLFMFFNTDIVDGHYLSEDYWFCYRWKKIGGVVYGYANTISTIKHWGIYAY
jgi:hypothetical protein